MTPSVSKACILNNLIRIIYLRTDSSLNFYMLNEFPYKLERKLFTSHLNQGKQATTLFEWGLSIHSKQDT